MTAIKEQPFQLGKTLSRYHVAIIGVSAPPVLREKLFAYLDQQAIELPRIHKQMMHKRTLKRRNLFLAVLLLGLLAARPQTPARGAASGSDVISFLNRTLNWYHQVSTQQELVRDPADLVFLNDNRPVADQIVRLSFDFARALAKASPTQPAATAPSDIASASSQYQRLAEAAARADQQVQQIQQELDGIRKKLSGTSGKKRTTLEATIAETQGELELFQARHDAIHSMMQVSNGRPGEATNLPAQVEELARTVPAAEDKEPGTAASASSSGSSVVAPASLSSKPPSGILAVISDVMAQRRRMGTLDEHLRLTDSLAQSARELRAPLGEEMRELAQKGDQLADQPDSTDPVVLAQQKKDLDALTAQYKQVSATLLPLGRQSILLDIYNHGVSNWRNAVKTQYQAGLKGLLVRLAGLGVILGVVFAISELWRRATFRYITDTRRRYQFLALRRFVVWSLVAIVIAIAFASELGAITTFAGFLTAGIAVALQNVILSVAGYFFLIGKHGLRVGDRVPVAGITGDVVEIGWVRLHLMEVSGGDSARPTGRVGAFSNAVVFQAGAGMFKQIPGTNFVWHEVTLALGPGSNYLQVEKRVMEAVNKVFSEYHDRMEMQRRTMERALYAVRTTALAPESRVRITSSGVEIVIRYPVDLDHAAESKDA